MIFSNNPRGTWDPGDFGVPCRLYLTYWSSEYLYHFKVSFSQFFLSDTTSIEIQIAQKRSGQKTVTKLLNSLKHLELQACLSSNMPKLLRYSCLRYIQLTSQSWTSSNPSSIYWLYAMNALVMPKWLASLLIWHWDALCHINDSCSALNKYMQFFVSM